MYACKYVFIHLGKSAVIDCYESQKNKIFKVFFKSSKKEKFLEKEQKIDIKNMKLYNNIKNAKSLYSVEDCK
jgi:hypothetical protein